MLMFTTSKWSSSFRGAYSALALFALLHLLILVGLVLYAWYSGKLDRAKVEQIAAVIRGDHRSDPQRSTAVETAPSVQVGPDTSAQKITEAIEQDEVQRLRTGRALADLRQFNALVDRRTLKLQKDQEEFEKKVAAQDEQSRLRNQQELGAAHAKTIDTIAQMDSKKAREFLMNAAEADAVRILLSLPDRKRKAVLESCKTPDQMTWRDRMLNAMLKEPAPGVAKGR